jgi:hypothetical protein
MSDENFKIPNHIMHDAVRTTLSQYKLSGGKGNSPYNFRCPICGDSKKNKNLKRGYILHNNDEWVYVCHNECGSMSFLSYLKQYHEDVYKSVCFHGFGRTSNHNVYIDNSTLAEKSYYSVDPAFKKGELLSIMDDHDLCKIARDFVQSRKIIERVYKQWYVCLPGDQFLDRNELGEIVIDENGLPKGNLYKNRLIIPYYHFGGKWKQFDARALFPEQVVRYKNYKGVEREPYNIDWLDVSRPFFLLEGCINSTFIENSISFGGTKHFEKLLYQYPQILENKHNCNVIWDNDDAGYDGLPKSIKCGFNWFNWKKIPIHASACNDINDLVLVGNVFEHNSLGYITHDSILQYCENSRGAILMTTLMYGDRDAIRKEKSKQLFNEMNNRRNNANKIDFSWS